MSIGLRLLDGADRHPLGDGGARQISIQLRRASTVVQTELVLNQYAYARQVDMFASAVEGHSTFAVPGEEGWQNQEVLDAAYRSIRSGNMETVPRVTANSVLE